MIRIALLGAAVLSLSGCDPATVLQKANAVDAPEYSCFTKPSGGCSFDQTPLRVEPVPTQIQRRPYQFFPTAQTLNFVDAGGRNWQAPRGTLTDGASIPEIFTTIVGSPTAPEYVSAAAVHDAYCGIGNETGARFHDARWQDVHHMFYNGLIVGGTPQFRAQLMYAAVWLGGPRWETTRRLDQVDVRQKQWAMQRTKSYIAQRKPTLPQLDGYLRVLEIELLEHREGKGGSPKEELIKEIEDLNVETPYIDTPYVEEPYFEDPYDNPNDPSAI
ncbi:DUF1353 domain-containing protein [Pelagimonas varians]|uniref:DUF1353 domain-containing protein n=1 Tax=Pelagimonas varians TaxID=696760 RepID=A0A238KG85_9RHOB|nr:DUF1353 domain-containing protein [Pelagimonas varians]PYG32360.1 uncharacterized protein DUF1353 [Pelagimonas varians]SMX41647.1 hypothetical protein PEV8663_02322 [Pelagimonas varians]